ncbi:LANO_0H03202g1_1 [Lachancea nothofagi CBS 11611]|uniref:LANO_0H03202g1_1 n=1 Tax=Lachancea nothofagi CBS 11611 TaxID=1266666 RepID=A0A1G4KLG7_9SACH|nr:LANO_0H03202g1_1 [Lachancea nothofagi CBS 11611]
MNASAKSVLINFASLCTSSWGLYGAASVALPSSLARAGHRQFLTNIAVTITIINNLVNLVSHLRFGRGLKHASRQFTLPMALVLETVVAAVYWPLRLFFLPLIMHNVNDNSRMPLSVPVDCAIHLMPLVFLALDYLVVESAPFQMSLKRAWVIVTALGLGYNRYLTWLIDRDAGEVYPYPFLDVPEPFKSAIFVAVTNVAWGFYVMYKRAHLSMRRKPKVN